MTALVALAVQAAGSWALWSTEFAAPLAAQVISAPGEWAVAGGDAEGTRYSPLDQIDRANVGELRVAWTYRTGESDSAFATRANPRLSATPIVLDGIMYLGTPLGRILALDPETGEELWAFDPEVDRDQYYGDFTNRGVAAWKDREAIDGAPEGAGERGPNGVGALETGLKRSPGHADTSAQCSRRIFIGTVDARLLAVDAQSGEPCQEFGRDGEVDLRHGLRIPPVAYSVYQVTSPPAVVGDVVITGSAIADNTLSAPASGEVRAWDARTGDLRWSWDPIPQDPADPAYGTWAPGSAEAHGAGNVWSLMSVDVERGLVFLPTTSPAPDYYGGRRAGKNEHTSSIVALRAATGELVWSFQTVRHDLWDYDNAAQPVLVTLKRDGREIPAVLAVTKTAQLFVLHRETGDPIFPVEERPVPASDVPGEEAWPTQRFTRDIAPLSPHHLAEEEVWGITEEDRAACRAMVSELRNEGIFTPPSLRGTLVAPSNIGGAHWGGIAFHPERQIGIIPVNRLASMVQLIPTEGFDRNAAQAESDRAGLGYQYTIMRGTPYTMRRRFLLSPSGLPCSPPPFGALVAIDLRTGERAWEVPLGDPGALMPEEAVAGVDTEALGMVNLGGAIVTAGGLAFVAGTADNTIRGFDLETGALLWRGELPAGARATPMTYRGPRSGRQYLTIAVGGGGEIWEQGDYVVTFALPEGPEGSDGPEGPEGPEASGAPR